jgi:hypothetical protein
MKETPENVALLKFREVGDFSNRRYRSVRRIDPKDARNDEINQW